MRSASESATCNSIVFIVRAPAVYDLGCEGAAGSVGRTHYLLQLSKVLTKTIGRLTQKCKRHTCGIPGAFIVGSGSVALITLVPTPFPSMAFFSNSFGPTCAFVRRVFHMQSPSLRHEFPHPSAQSGQNRILRADRAGPASAGACLILAQRQSSAG